MYYLEVLSLEDCPFCNATQELLTLKGVNHQIINIPRSEKENFKNDKINTFPQIYLKKENSNGRLLIGGYDKLKIINNTIMSGGSLVDISNSIKKIGIDKFSKKASLRLIELFSD